MLGVSIFPVVNGGSTAVGALSAVHLVEEGEPILEYLP